MRSKSKNFSSYFSFFSIYLFLSSRYSNFKNSCYSCFFLSLHYSSYWESFKHRKLLENIGCLYMIGIFDIAIYWFFHSLCLIKMTLNFTLLTFCYIDDNCILYDSTLERVVNRIRIANIWDWKIFAFFNTSAYDASLSVA